ncbi:MAG: carboxylesterase family protein [Actinomycetia bacterium]|nr:carboxylesterase family protein [Actinomycetes bacterium]
MPGLFLAVSIVGALFTLNAYFPIRRTVQLGFPSFIAAWVTNEAAPLQLLWQIAATVLFVILGALDHPLGWVGLGITLVSWAALIGLIVQSFGTRSSMVHALAAVFGPDFEDHIDTDLAGSEPRRLAWRQIFFPLRFSTRAVEVTRNVAYREQSGRRGRLDVYRPKGSDAGDARPTLLYVHGGGWITGSKRDQGRPLLERLAGDGWVCVACNYRLAPRSVFPAQAFDVKEALRWTKEVGPAYGVDPGFVVIGGGSAGGHLAALTALTANDPGFQPGWESVDTSVAACVSFYGVYDFTNGAHQFHPETLPWLLRKFVMRVPFDDEHRNAYEQASPYFRINPDAPPFLIAAGTRDTLVPIAEARRFVAALREVSRAPVVYAELHGAQHAFDTFHSIRTALALTGAQQFVDVLRTAYRRGVPLLTGALPGPARPGPATSLPDPPGSTSVATSVTPVGSATNGPTTTGRTAPS